MLSCLYLGQMLPPINPWNATSLLRTAKCGLCRAAAAPPPPTDVHAHTARPVPTSPPLPHQEGQGRAHHSRVEGSGSGSRVLSCHAGSCRPRHSAPRQYLLMAAAALTTDLPAYLCYSPSDPRLRTLIENLQRFQRPGGAAGHTNTAPAGSRQFLRANLVRVALLQVDFFPLCCI